MLQLQLAGPVVDSPYDAVLLDNEDIALWINPFCPEFQNGDRD